MVVVMTPEATDADIEAVAERVRANGGEAFVSRGTVSAIRSRQMIFGTVASFMETARRSGARRPRPVGGRRAGSPG